MKRIVRTLALLGLLLGSFTSQAAPEASATHAQVVISGDYYSGLITGIGHKDYYASLYSAGTPAYTEAIDWDYRWAIQNLRSAQHGNDQNNIDF